MKVMRSHRLNDFDILPKLSDGDSNKCDNHKLRKLNGDIDVKLTSFTLT